MCQKHVQHLRVFVLGPNLMNLNCQPPVQIELLIQIHPKSLILIGGSDLDRQMVVQRLSSNSLNLVPGAEADTENLIN